MMKRFLIQCSIFVLEAYLCVYLLGEGFAFIIGKYGKNFLNNADYKVTEAILRSNQKNHPTKKLVIGDSVASSLYNDDNNGSVTSLASTVALTTVGQYCLMANFIENNAEHLPDEIVLIMNPLCWNNTLEGGLAYSTFAKNFFNDQFKPYLDKEETDYINQWPYAWLMEQEWFRLCPYTANPTEHLEKGEYISPQQYRYLQKMVALCKAKGIGFRLLSGPVRESLSAEIDSMFIGKKHTDEPLFQAYYHSIIYWTDNRFTDQLHLKSGCVPKDYFNLYEANAEASLME